MIFPKYFYDDPTAGAEFDYWSKLPDWSLEEIVALSCYKDPRVVHSEKFVHGTRGTKFSTTYFARLEIVQRHHLAGELGSWTRTIKVINWAEEYEFPLPQELVKLVRQVEQKRLNKQQPENASFASVATEGPVQQTTYGSEFLDSKTTQTRLAVSKSSATDSRSGPSRNERLLDLREQQNLQLMIAAMAIKSYKFNKNLAKNEATQKIIKHISDLGITLSKATVLKNIRRGIELLDERANPKT